MKTQITTLALSLLLSTASYASATEFMGGDVSGNVALTSDYLFRGISQSNEAPAIQGGFDYENGAGFTAGLWASNVNFSDNDEASIEVDYYFGYDHAVSEKLSVGGSFIAYTYPGANSALDYDFQEVALNAGYDFDFLSAGASVNYSPEYFGASDEAWYYEVTASKSLSENWGVDANFGRQTIENNTKFGTPDYNTWGVGVTYEENGLALSVAYVDTDLSTAECADGCEARGVVTLSKAF